MLPSRMSNLRRLEGRGQCPRRADKLRQRRTANPTKRSPAHASNPSPNGRNGLGGASFKELISAGRAVRITPELADPVGSLEVGEHEDVEQLGAGSGTLFGERSARSILHPVCGEPAAHKSFGLKVGAGTRRSPQQRPRPRDPAPCRRRSCTRPCRRLRRRGRAAPWASAAS